MADISKYYHDLCVSESNRGYTTRSTSQQEPRSNNYTAGLSEEEQVQRAREESLRDEESRS